MTLRCSLSLEEVLLERFAHSNFWIHAHAVVLSFLEQVRHDNLYMLLSHSATFNSYLIYNLSVIPGVYNTSAAFHDLVRIPCIDRLKFAILTGSTMSRKVLW